MDDERKLTRKEIAALLTSKGYKTSPKFLAKLASTGGGPEYELYGNLAIYTPSKAIDWAVGRLSKPRHSTSEAA